MKYARRFDLYFMILFPFLSLARLEGMWTAAFDMAPAIFSR
jgi:hypothetical protein